MQPILHSKNEVTNRSEELSPVLGGGTFRTIAETSRARCNVLKRSEKMAIWRRDAVM